MSLSLSSKAPPIDIEGVSMRLNRFLSASGYSSRRKGEEIIRAGRLEVNGIVVTDPAKPVDPRTDAVTVDGVRLVITAEKRYYVMNKSTGLIVSHGDTHGRPTVFDILGPETKGVFPVGRLDADTSGVLLFSDDGDLTYRLTHPSFGVEKVYRAEVKGHIDRSDVQRFKNGVVLDDGPTAPADMTILKGGKDMSLVEITLHEGRKRQVRRMFKHIGHPVATLERVSFGGVTVDGLSLGHYRLLKPGEIERLKRAVSPCSRGEYE